VRKEREEEEASREQLQKYVERKKRLSTIKAKKLARIIGKAKAKVKAQSASKGVHIVGASAVSRAVDVVERSIEGSHLENLLRPQVARIKATLTGAARRAAIQRLVSSAVAAKVDAALQKNPNVRAAVSRAVGQLRHKLGLPAIPTTNVHTAAAKSMKADSSLAAKAKVEAAAAVKKVQAARKSLDTANAKLSKAVSVAGKKGLTELEEEEWDLPELALIQAARSDKVHSVSAPEAKYLAQLVKDQVQAALKVDRASFTKALLKKGVTHDRISAAQSQLRGHAP